MPYVASTSYNQTITSPNYPLNYDNNLDCAWLIQVNNTIPSLHILLVKVTFNDFLLGYDTGPCKDVLRFYDGSGSYSDLLGSYCGTTPPEVIYPTGKQLYVTFHTDSFITYTGFSFRFSAVKEGNCLTNRYLGGMRLFTHTSLMTSKSSKGKKVALVSR